MIDSAILFPDTGREFLKTLRLSILYSQKVNVFTPTKLDTLLGAQGLLIEYQRLIAGEELPALEGHQDFVSFMTAFRDRSRGASKSYSPLSAP